MLPLLTLSPLVVPVLPPRGGLPEHPHARLSPPPGPPQTPPLGGLDADRRRVSIAVAAAAATRPVSRFARR